MVALCEAACKYVHNVKCWRLAGVTTFTFSSFTHTFHTNHCTDRRWHNIVNLKLLYAMCVTRKTVIFTSATSSSLRFSIFRHQSASAWVADGQRQANTHCMCRTVQHNFGCADLQTYSRGWRKCPKLKYWTLEIVTLRRHSMKRWSDSQFIPRKTWMCTKCHAAPFSVSQKSWWWHLRKSH